MIKYYLGVVLFFGICIMGLSANTDKASSDLLAQCLGSNQVISLSLRASEAYRPWAKDITKYRYNEAKELCYKKSKEYFDL